VSKNFIIVAESFENIFLKNSVGKGITQICASLALCYCFPEVSPYLLITNVPILVKNSFVALTSVIWNQNLGDFFIDYDLNKAETYVFLLKNAEKILCPMLTSKTNVCKKGFTLIKIIFGASFFASFILSIVFDLGILVQIKTLGKDKEFDSLFVEAIKKNSCLYSVVINHNTRINRAKFDEFKSKMEEDFAKEFNERFGRTFESSYNDRSDYQILGLNSDASESEIKQAYRLLALEHHPDKNPNAVINQWYEIANAYEKLKKNFEK